MAHDLSVVRYLCDTVIVIVMSRGKMAEMAQTEELFEHPLRPYPQTLLSAVPVPDPDVNMMQFDWRDVDVTLDSSAAMEPDVDPETTVWEQIAPDHFVSIPAG